MRSQMTAENPESPKPKRGRPKKTGDTYVMDLNYFRRVGAKGGKARAKKHGKRKLRKWGKMGGRPSVKEKPAEVATPTAA